MYTGDFIQRHAKAAALYDQIIVLHVVKAENPFFTESTFEEIITEDNLTKHIKYFTCRIRWRFLNRLVSILKYFWLSTKMIETYLQDKDAPKLVHLHVPLKAGLVALWVKRRYKLPYLLTEHYGIYNSAVEDSFEKRDLLFRYFTKRIIKNAALFLPVSRNMGETINLSLLPKPYTVVYNTVDASLFYHKQNKPERFKFIHVSGMETLKNVDGIIRCFVKVLQKKFDCELLIVGKPDKKLQELASDTGFLNKNIFFTGEVSYSMVAAHMQSSSAMVLFSRTENMPCVILEALCCGLPVIATSVGGIPEVVNESNGFLVKSEDETALQQSFVDMLTHYEKFDRASIAEEAKKRFSYEVIGKQLDNLYSACFDQEGGSLAHLLF